MRRAIDASGLEEGSADLPFFDSEAFVEICQRG